MTNAKLNNLLIASVAGKSLDVSEKDRGRLQLLSLAVNQPVLIVLAARSMARDREDPEDGEDAVADAREDAKAAAVRAGEARDGAKQSEAAAAGAADAAAAAAGRAEAAAKAAQAALESLKSGDNAPPPAKK